MPVQSQKLYPLVHLLLDNDGIIHVMIPGICERAYRLDQIDELGEFLYLIGAEDRMPQLEPGVIRTLNASAAKPEYFYDTAKYLAMPEYP